MDKETKKIIENLLLAYHNKDEECPHDFEIEAVKNAEAAIDDTQELIQKAKKLLIDIEKHGNGSMWCNGCSAYVWGSVLSDTADLIRGLVRELERKMQ